MPTLRIIWQKKVEKRENSLVQKRFAMFSEVFLFPILYIP